MSVFFKTEINEEKKQEEDSLLLSKSKHTILYIAGQYRLDNNFIHQL
jgi:hypothetical protein